MMELKPNGTYAGTPYLHWSHAVAALELRVQQLEHTLRDVLEAPHVHGVDRSVSGTRAAVLVQRHGGRIDAKHVKVSHQKVLGAAPAIEQLGCRNWAFVEPSEVGVVLDAFEVSDGA